MWSNNPIRVRTNQLISSGSSPDRCHCRPLDGSTQCLGRNLRGVFVPGRLELALSWTALSCARWMGHISWQSFSVASHRWAKGGPLHLTAGAPLAKESRPRHPVIFGPFASFCDKPSLLWRAVFAVLTFRLHSHLDHLGWTWTLQDEHLNKEQRFEETPGVFHPDAWYINGRGRFTKILFKIQYSYRSCMHRMVPSATMATCPDACRINATGNAQIMRVLVHFALWRLPNKLSY